VDYDLETKSRICSACIDNDLINCEDGASIIQAFRNEKQKIEERKQRMVEFLQKQQAEIKELYRELQ
jgi:Skp family chaperone for outer membrane proteins